MLLENLKVLALDPGQAALLLLGGKDCDRVWVLDVSIEELLVDQRMVFIGCPLCLRGEGMHRLVRDVGGADQSLPDLSASCSDPTGELLALGVSCLGIAKDTLVYLRLLQLELGIRSHSTVLELLLSTL